MGCGEGLLSGRVGGGERNMFSKGVERGGQNARLLVEDGEKMRVQSVKGRSGW